MPGSVRGLSCCNFFALVTLCASVLSPFAGFGQELPLRHYTSEKEVNPLPGNAVTVLFQDQEGFLWFGVYGDGLVRYDGSKLELYTDDKELHLHIWSVTQDGKGRLWLATEGGLRASERPLPEYGPGEKVHFSARIDGVPLMDDHFRNRGELLADRKGNVWATHVGRVVRYHYSKGGDLDADTISLESLPADSRKAVFGLTALRRGGVWGITNDDHILEFGEDGAFIRSTRLEIGKSVAVTQSLTQYMLEDDRGDIWGARRDGIIWRLLSRDSVYRAASYVKTPGVNLAQPVQIGNDRFIAGSVGEGLVEWSAAQPEIDRRYKTGNGLLNNVIWDVIQDREGNIWIASSSGVSRMPGDYRAFGHYTSNSLGGSISILPEDGVNTVLANMRWQMGPLAPVESLLVAGTSQGIAFIRSDGSREIVQMQDGLLNNAILSLYQDPAGRLWIAGRMGVTCMSQDPGLLDLPDLSPPVRHQLWGVPVYLAHLPVFHTITALELALPLSENSEETINSLWLVGDDQLLCLAGTRWYHFWKNTGAPKSMRTATVDRKGFLYLGDFNQAVYRSTTPLSLEKLRSLSLKPGTSKGFEDIPVVQDSIFRPYPLTANGDTLAQVCSFKWYGDLLWVGTGNGCFAFPEGSASAALEVVLKDSTRSNFFQTMTLTEDPPVLWAGTKTGLVAIDPATGEVLRTIDKHNGLADNISWGFTGIDAGADGAIYWGTPKGLSIYRPGLDAPDTIAPLLKFRQFSLKQDDWGNNELAVEFSAISFYDEKETKFQTRLKGYDENWSELSSDTRIRYTNLPAFLFPGTYTFEVKAQNVFGTWSDVPLSRQVSIQPPLWLRWWAVLIYILLLFVLVRFYIKWRTRKHEEALVKERQVSDQLRQIDLMKDQFLANTSHELRTPLNGIIGLSESLAERSTDPLALGDLHLIISSGKRLANLVNDLLDFSQLKNDQLRLHLGPVDMHALTDVILTLTRPLVGEKPLQLVNVIPRDLPPVNADENRIQQILHNLIGNAVKFTRKGSVTVYGRVNEDRVEITVSDTGIGIAPEKQEIIFNAFEQGDGSTTRMFGGTGLGLAVTRQLIEAHGGEIWVESAPGKGAKFTFSLPLAVGTREESPIKTGKDKVVDQRISPLKTDLLPPFAGLSGPVVTPQISTLDNAVRILIVDDEPVNLRVLENHLVVEGYEVTTAGDGIRALEILRQDRMFDLIILDIMMPGMSGYEVCEELRELFLPSELPVVMLTAKNRITDLVDGFNAGANDYLTKPFSRDELLSRIRTHLRLHRINRATSKFVPNEFLRSIGRDTITEVQLGDMAEREVTVFFSDIRKFTEVVETMSPEEAFRFVNAYNRRIGPVIKQYKGFINQYLGDGIMALFMGGQEDALCSAIRMQEVIREYNAQRIAQKRLPIQVGMGLHTGPLVLGIIGDQHQLNAAIIADTVNTASRIENLTKHYGANILLSEDLLSGIADRAAFHFRPLGKFLFKGKEKPVVIFECIDGDPPEIFRKKLASLELFKSGVDHFYSRRFREAKSAFEEVLTLNPDDLPTQLFLEKAAAYVLNEAPDDWTGVEKMMVK